MDTVTQSVDTNKGIEDANLDAPTLILTHAADHQQNQDNAANLLQNDSNHETNQPATLSVQSANPSQTVFNPNSGHQVVMGFRLTNSQPDMSLSNLTIAASGELNEKQHINEVRLYVDLNQNGMAELSEIIAVDQYTQDNGMITFYLNSSFALPVGESQFLVSYQFN